MNRLFRTLSSGTETEKSKKAEKSRKLDPTAQDTVNRLRSYHDLAEVCLLSS